MARASSPGLTVSPRVEISRKRILPVRGKVLVEAGEWVEMGKTVASALLPGPLLPVRAAAMVSVPPKELKAAMKVKEGDPVTKGQILAESKSLFGLFSSRAPSPIDGTVETISKVTGQVMLRPRPEPLEIQAYLPGRVAHVIEGLGVEIEAQVTMVQGIFGLGGEVHGPLVKVAADLKEPVGADRIKSEHKGAVLLSGSQVTLDALTRMQDVGVSAAIAGSASGQDLLDLTRGDLNPQATGSEEIGMTLVLTEGFGKLTMAKRTFELLSKLVGQEVSVNGTTQIRAGVIRPEVIGLPCGDDVRSTTLVDEIEIGSRVRIVRGEAFGKTGKIAAIPNKTKLIGSGATALVFEIELDDATKITIPRPNAELLYE